MSASEMERLLAELADWKSMHADEVGHHNQTLGVLRDLIYRPHDDREWAKARAVLSGSSAPQATDSEELLKALRAARHALEVFLEAQASGSANHLKLAASAARAALSMKSEGSDPDSSQKGEP